MSKRRQRTAQPQGEPQGEPTGLPMSPAAAAADPVAHAAAAATATATTSAGTALAANIDDDEAEEAALAQWARGGCRRLGRSLLSLSPSSAVWGRCALDLRALAAFRVAIGVLQLLDLAQRMSNYSALYAPRGSVIPAALQSAHRPHAFHHSLLLLFAAEPWADLWCLSVLSLGMLAALSLALGYRTRLAGLLSYAVLLSAQSRLPEACNKGDMVLRVVCLWALFLPTHARFSIDARGKNVVDSSSTHSAVDSAGADSSSAKPVTELGGGGDTSSSGGSNNSSGTSSNSGTSNDTITTTRINSSHAFLSVASVAYCAQISCIYLFNALLKLQGRSWTDGSAAFYALQGLDVLKRPGLWAGGLPYPLLRWGTFAVLGLELVGAATMLSRRAALRTATLAALAAMHLSFMLSMRLGLFQWACIAALLPFLPPAVVDALQELWQRGWQRWREHKADPAAAAVFVLVDWVDRRVLPSRGTGASNSHPASKSASTAASPSSSSSSTATPATAVAHRSRGGGGGGGGGNTRPRVPGRGRTLTLDIAPARAASFAAGCLLVIVLLWNASMYAPTAGLLPGWVYAALRVPFSSLHGVVHLVGAAQRWDMYAPEPYRSSAWPLVRAHLADRSYPVDVMRSLDAGVVLQPRWDAPNGDDEPLVSDVFPDHRWAKLLLSMARPGAGREWARQAYAQYLCARWARAIATKPRSLGDWFPDLFSGLGHGGNVPAFGEMNSPPPRLRQLELYMLSIPSLAPPTTPTARAQWEQRQRQLPTPLWRLLGKYTCPGNP